MERKMSKKEGKRRANKADLTPIGRGKGEVVRYMAKRGA